MATTPCALVVFTTDKFNFSPYEAYIVMQQIFRYGVKDISLRGEEIFIKLSYSPKAKTLKKKFGNLPVRYMRAKFKNDEEFNVLEKIVHKYKFNLTNNDLDDEHHLQVEGKTRKYLEPPQLHEEEDDIEQETTITTTIKTTTKKQKRKM